MTDEISKTGAASAETASQRELTPAARRALAEAAARREDYREKEAALPK
ncbi:DUF1674 domain-containing protein, partial [Mesorhizobium sp. M7A.F.Ca.CA.001.12.1.1]